MALHFLEEDLAPGPLPRAYKSQNMIEMIRRGNGFRDLASKQAVNMRSWLAVAMSIYWLTPGKI